MSACCSGFTGTADAQFGVRRAQADLRRFLKKGPDPTTRLLIEGLKDGPAPLRSVLDIGAGVGLLAFELMAGSDMTATVVDASEAYLDAARQESARRGLADRCTFHRGDFVDLSGTLPEADAVAMDRVVCCYPEYRPLLMRALAHARRRFAFSYPRDRWYVRLGVRVANLLLRIRGNRFRSFVHAPEAMGDLAREGGFRLARRRLVSLWCVETWERRAEGA